MGLLRASHNLYTPFAAFAALARPADWDYESDSDSDDDHPDEDVEANDCVPLSPAPSRTLPMPSWIPPPPEVQVEVSCSFFDDVGTDCRRGRPDWTANPLQYLMGMNLIVPRDDVLLVGEVL
jgi:hypothetical protein